MNSGFMSGQFDLGLVALSYVVAALAAYSAIDLVQRIRQNPRNQWLWLLLGAVAMGSGIWAMHFIGMQAFTLPIQLGYDHGKTVISLVAAIAVALLALWASSREAMGARSVGIGALLMGAGICAMHYIGMYAMEMQPGIVWSPLWVLASVVIAVVASAAALWILFNLRRIDRRYQMFARLAAAAIMGLAVVGMHYTGMAAANFPIGAICGAAGSLTGMWMAWPLAGLTAALTVMIMILAAYDVRAQKAREEAERQQALEERARTLALYDLHTMMRNRASFQQEIVALIHRCERAGARFDLFYGSVRFPGIDDIDGINEAMSALAERLRPLVRDADFLARYSKSEFTLLRPRKFEADLPNAMHQQLMAACTRPLRIGDRMVTPVAHVGVGAYPEDGVHSRQLLQAALRTPEQTQQSAAAPRASEQVA